MALERGADVSRRSIFKKTRAPVSIRESERGERRGDWFGAHLSRAVRLLFSPFSPNNKTGAPWHKGPSLTEITGRRAESGCSTSVSCALRFVSRGLSRAFHLALLGAT